MSWDNQGGGGPWGNNGGSGGSGSPWGRGTGGQGGGQTPPDIDEVIRRGQAKLKGLLPKGFGGWKAGLLIALVLLGIWAANGFYRVQPNQEGVPVLLGRFVGTTTNPGLHWNWPAPIGKVYTPDVTAENRIEIGLRTSGESSRRGASVRDMPEESQMITGDENIVDIDFVVFWRISDAPNYLFNIRNPDETVKMAAESVMRAIIGQTPIQEALTSRREDIEARTLSSLQKLMSEYQAGIQVRQVQLLAVLPPKNVIDAFDEVSRARQDMDRLKNEAEAFRNDIVPRARGEAQQLLQGAEAYRQEVVNRAQGDANRFNSVYQAYRQSKDVTTTRIYLETLETIFSNVNKVIIDSEVGKAGGGVVPYLPLPEIKKKQQNNSSSQGANN
ncbi:MAG: FtsH protease activity modulator HflK [Pseudomonadota bacterium]|nr:FtsH protease activity modulator HflK [Pseudomonadota bacterium]|tara:strand:+ start:1288 stop:2445 length:1158 start_codon:yes stop_codon:yes gene_type:complete